MSVPGEGPGNFCALGANNDRCPRSITSLGIFHPLALARCLIPPFPAQPHTTETHKDIAIVSMSCRPRCPREVLLSPGRLPFLFFFIDSFDASFFGITPREARAIDPTQHLMLETCWEGFDRVGYTMNQLHGSQANIIRYKDSNSILSL